MKFSFSIWHKDHNERSSKLLDAKIKESHQRGLPLTTQQLQPTEKDKRLSSTLIAPDEMVWLKAAQIGGRMCVCKPSRRGSNTNILVLNLICETSLFSRKKRMTDGALFWEGKVGCLNYQHSFKRKEIAGSFKNMEERIFCRWLLNIFIFAPCTILTIVRKTKNYPSSYVQ